MFVASQLFFWYYLKLQLRDGFLDYTDQVRMPHLLFEAFPDTLENWSHRYQYILVDEFQDVSAENYILCDVLSGESNNLFVVGDTDQMIYSWRNGEIEYLQQFDKAHPGTETFTLAVNRRSASKIVRVSNNLILHNETHNPDNVMMAADNATEGKIMYYHADAQYGPYHKLIWDDEATIVANRIAQLLHEGVKGNRIAVLYRKHAAADTIKKELRNRNIPYKENREDDFYELPLIRKLKMLLKLVDDETSFDFEEFRELLNNREEASALDSIMLETTEKISYGELVARVSLDAGRFPESNKLIRAVTGVKAYAEDQTTTLSGTIGKMLSDSGIFNEVKHYQINDESNAIISLDKRVKALQQRSTDLSLRDFIEIIDCRKKPYDDDENEVQLSTIHAAKGLEFDYVFVIRMANRIIPSQRVRDYSQFEEERRLAYVAFTRAKKELWMSENAGANTKPGPSCFILEAGIDEEDLIEQVSEPLAEKYIEEVLFNMKEKEDRLRTISWAIANELCETGSEVEHRVFGRGEILYIDDSGTLVIKFDRIAQPIPISDPSNLIPYIPEEKLREYSDFMVESHIEEQPNDRRADDRKSRALEVLALINKTVADKANRNKVSVLGLPCGTGKSTAISYKICDVIAAYENGGNEGMLIMSNTKVQLHAYLNPGGEAEDYIWEHMDKIVQMDSDNMAEAMKRMKYAPVLIITTQRYLCHDWHDLQDAFLTFNNDYRRTLIIIDEEPELYKTYEIAFKELNNIDTLINQGMNDQINQSDKAYCAAFWKAWSSKIRSKLTECQQKAMQETKETKKSSYYEFVVDREEDQDQTLRLFRQNRFFDIMRRYRYNMSFSVKGINMDAFDYIEALWNLRKFGGLYEFKSGQPYYNRFIIRTDKEVHFFRNQGAKVLILDGTADISPVYKSRMFDPVPCERFKRTYPNLTIKLYNQASGESSLKEQDYAGFKKAVEIIKNDIASTFQPEDKWAVFTYKGLEDNMRTALSEYSNVQIGHFGNLRGKNDFNEAKHIVQVGLNRWSSSSYFFFEFVYELEEDMSKYREVLYDIRHENQTSKRIQEDIKSKAAQTKKCMDQFLLCDIEQNLFRGIIRNDESTPYTFHLILSFSEYQGLIAAIKERYESSGATVVIPPSDKDLEEELFFAWHNRLTKGFKYTGKMVLEVVKHPEMKKIQDYTRSHPDIKAVLDDEHLSRDTYVKRVR